MYTGECWRTKAPIGLVACEVLPDDMPSFRVQCPKIGRIFHVYKKNAAVLSKIFSISEKLCIFC